MQMTVKMIARRTLNPICTKIIESRIRNHKGSAIWPPHQMFLDWFGLHRTRTDRLKSCWWRPMQSKQEGTREWRKSRTEYVNVSPASLCILTECFCWRYIMGKWWAEACTYRLINRCIAGTIKLLARNINLSHVWANSATMLLRSALPQGQVLIWQKDFQ